MLNKNIEKFGAADARYMHYIRFLLTEETFKHLSNIWIKGREKGINISPVEIMLDALKTSFEKAESLIEHY